MQLQRRFCVTDRASNQHIGRGPSPRPWTLACNQTAICSVCRLMVCTLIIHVITCITTQLPTTEGWKAELAWLADTQRTPYRRSDHMSTIDQAQIRESPPAKDRPLNPWATPPWMLHRSRDQCTNGNRRTHSADRRQFRPADQAPSLRYGWKRCPRIVSLPWSSCTAHPSSRCFQTASRPPCCTPASKCPCTPRTEERSTRTERVAPPAGHNMNELICITTTVARLLLIITIKIMVKT